MFLRQRQDIWSHGVLIKEVELVSFSIIKWSQADSGIEYLIGRLDGVFISPTQRVMSIRRGTCWTLSGEWLRLSWYPAIKSQRNIMKWHWEGWQWEREKKAQSQTCIKLQSLNIPQNSNFCKVYLYKKSWITIESVPSQVRFKSRFWLHYHFVFLFSFLNSGAPPLHPLNPPKHTYL